MRSPDTSARRRRRAVGRPSGDDSGMRERLLDAAVTCFVRKGIGSTSLRAIATEAGVTPAMLHYYFGDKQRLTQALIDERLLPALGQVQARLRAAGDDPARLIEAFVRGIGEAVRAHPWLPPLWVREVLCEGGALREMVLSEVAPRVPVLLAQRFAAARAAGQLPAGLDPQLLVMSLVGLTLFPAAGAPVWTKMFDAQPLQPEALVEHALTLLGHGVGADLGDPR